MADFDDVMESAKSLYKGKRWATRLLIGFLGLLGVAIVSGLFFLVVFVDFVDNYEQGYLFDTRTGEITVLDRTGYIVNPPYLIRVHSIDMRPMQVCINANQRVLNCKLVRFNPGGIDLFISWHGRGDYSGATLNAILKSYAYDGLDRRYPFLDVLRELIPDGEMEGLEPAEGAR